MTASEPKRVGCCRLARVAVLSVLVFLALAPDPAAAISMTRGPYLNQGADDGVTIRWRTDSNAPSRVRYGLSPSNLNQTVDDADLTREHVITLTGLNPGTKYYYSVENFAKVFAGYDADHYFYTSPEAGERPAIRVWVIGDSGEPGADAEHVRNAYLTYTGSTPTDVWLMLGDNAYPSGSDTQYQAALFDMYQTILRNTVLWPTRGNHDLLYSGGNNDYYEIFTLPDNGEAGGLASGTEAYYSFDYGNAHFVCLDSYDSDRTPAGAMLSWLTSDLAATTQEWIIAYWHHPPYTKGSHDSDDDTDSQGRMTDMRENALPILEAAGVDLVLSGHSHSYERSFLLDEHYGYSSTLHDSMKIDAGDGAIGSDGAYEKPFGLVPHQGAVYAVSGSASKLTPGPLSHPVMVSTHYTLGSMVLDIDGSRLDAVFIDSTGTVLDSFSIVKGQPQIAVTRGPYLNQGTPDGVTIRWRTDVDVPSRIRYGTDPESLAGQEDDATPKGEHKITLGGLQPNTKYYYTVETFDAVLAGGDSSHCFHTSPSHGSGKPTRIWAIGDSGQPGQDAIDVRDAYVAYTGETRTDVWLMLGDNAYPTGTDAEYQAAVFDMYPTLLRNTVLWPTRGNHDLLHGGDNNDYYDIFSLPSDGEAGGTMSGTEAYYSFDYGNIHFVCLDSHDSDRSPGGAMMTWLGSDLAATAQDWIIAYWHHPPYTKGSHDSDDIGDSGGRMIDMRENALPILEAGGVDVVLCGHSHSYERSFLLDEHYGYSSTLHDSMKIVDGNGSMWGGDGAYLKPTWGKSPHEGAVYAVAGSSSKLSPGPLDHPVMVSAHYALGSMVLDVDGNQLDAVFLDATGTVLDDFTIIKGMTPTGIETRPVRLYTRLDPASPNPFGSATRLGYTIPSGGNVRLTIYDVKGRRVRDLIATFKPRGSHASVWDARDTKGRAVVPGVYFAVLEYGNEKRARKLIHVR